MTTSGLTVTPSGNSDELLRRARLGEDQALQALMDQLAPHMKMVVRRRLPRLMRRRFDSTDFVQAAWASFLTGDGLNSRFNSPSEVERYLGASARNKVLMAIRGHIETAARDMRLEVDVQPIGHPGSGEFSFLLVEQQAGPASVALANDLRETVRKRLSEELREVLALREDGYTANEIAERMGLSTRSVERALAKLREQYP